jgi:hypothetical protein
MADVANVGGRDVQHDGKPPKSQPALSSIDGTSDQAYIEKHHPLARAEAIRALAAHKALIECVPTH